MTTTTTRLRTGVLAASAATFIAGVVVVAVAGGSSAAPSGAGVTVVNTPLPVTGTVSVGNTPSVKFDDATKEVFVARGPWT